MFEVISLSKSKPRSIVLLHGLFTGPGFWLPYLKHFSDYNIVLIDINYSLMPDVADFLPELSQKIKKISETKDLVAIISHSLGTFLSALLGENLSKRNIHICPIYISERQCPDQFAQFISARDKAYSADDVLLVLRKVDEFVRKNMERLKEVEVLSTFLLIPDQDPFFRYITDSLDVSFFPGDHFEIDKALLKLKVDGDI